MIRLLIRNSLIRILYIDRTEPERMLLLSSLFACTLVLARLIYSGKSLFVFMPWNLFLASVPYVITEWLSARPAWIEKKWRFFSAFLVWLLFVPNSFYILTDLFHLGISDEAPLWYDLALLLSFAWTGLLLGILSIRRMEMIFSLAYSFRYRWVFIAVIMFLNALGVYIGRYLRFNSWDVLANPIGLAADISYILIHPLRNPGAWGMIACYALLMTLLYYSIKKISQSFNKL